MYNAIFSYLGFPSGNTMNMYQAIAAMITAILAVRAGTFIFDGLGDLMGRR